MRFISVSAICTLIQLYEHIIFFSFLKIVIIIKEYIVFLNSFFFREVLRAHTIIPLIENHLCKESDFKNYDLY